MQFQELTQEKRTQGKVGFEKEESRVTDFLYENSAVVEMLNSLKTDHTRNNYAYALSQFFRAAQITPDEFLVMNDTEIYNLMVDYFRYLEKNENPSRAKNAKFAVRKLLRRVGRDLNIRPEDDIEYYNKRSTTDNKHIPTKEEIYKMVEVTTSIRNKAFMICLYHSGLRKGTLNQLTYGMVKNYLFDEDGDDLEDPILPIVFKVSRRGKLGTLKDGKASKTIDVYYSYLALEGALALRDLIDWRIVNENWVPKDEHLIFTSQGYMGRGHSRSHKSYWTRPLQKTGFINTAAERIGIPKEKIWIHLLRSAFQNFCDRESGDPVFSQLLMGHKLQSGVSASHYGDYGDSPEKREQYMKIDWSRVVTRRVRSLEDKTDIQNKEIETLKQQVNQLTVVIKSLLSNVLDVTVDFDSPEAAAKLYDVKWDIKKK